MTTGGSSGGGPSGGGPMAAGRTGSGARPPFRLLFVCTGNSARSQLAEGLANHLGAGRVEAQSAGTMPFGVSSYAVAVLRERGIDIAGHYSKGLDDVVGPFDLVITLCDSAVRDCPRSLFDAPHRHWSTLDPSFVAGGPGAVHASFQQVRDRLEAQILALIEEVHPGEPAS